MAVKSSRFRFNLTVALAILLLASCLSPLLAGQKTAVETKLAPSSFYTNFTDIPLNDHKGKVYKLEELQGKAVLFNFFFTQCGDTCPLQVHDLQKIQKSLSPDVKKNVQFVSVSLDPSYDTPKQLADYIQRMKVDSSNWAFLTGQKLGIATLVSRLRLANGMENKTESPFRIHNTALWLVDGKGQLMQRYSGNPIEIKRMIMELTQLSKLNNLHARHISSK